ncbi:hypothetical protein N8608_03355 [bacterium]|nr:hypothetical protein [bacterium]
MQRVNEVGNGSRHTTLDQTIEEHVWCRRINSTTTQTKLAALATDIDEQKNIYCKFQAVLLTQ